MLLRIKTLNAESKTYLIEEDRLNHDIFKCKNDKKTDNFEKYLYGSLEYYLGSSYNIQVIKPYALFKDLQLGQHSGLQLSEKDYIVVLAGLNDDHISTKDVTKLIDVFQNKYNFLPYTKSASYWNVIARKQTTMPDN